MFVLFAAGFYFGRETGGYVVAEFVEAVEDCDDAFLLGEGREGDFDIANTIFVNFCWCCIMQNVLVQFSPSKSTLNIIFQIFTV